MEAPNTERLPGRKEIAAVRFLPRGEKKKKEQKSRFLVRFHTKSLALLVSAVLPVPAISPF